MDQNERSEDERGPDIFFSFSFFSSLERWDANVLPRPRKGKRFHVSTVDYGLLSYDYDLVALQEDKA